MTKNEAIELLNRQKARLDKTGINSVWISQTASIVKDLLGEGSDEYRWIKSTKLPIWTPNQDMNTYISVNTKNDAIRFIIACVDTIERKGLYRKPKTNFLQRWDNATLATVIIFALGVVFGGGTLLGRYISDVQNIELRQEVKNLVQQNQALQKHNADLEQQLKEINTLLD